MLPIDLDKRQHNSVRLRVGGNNQNDFGRGPLVDNTQATSIGAAGYLVSAISFTSTVRASWQGYDIAHFRFIYISSSHSFLRVWGDHDVDIRCAQSSAEN